MENHNIKVELVVVNSSKLKGSVTISNQSDTVISVNQFDWETATLSLELEKISNNRNTIIPLLAPPVPPSNLKDYEVSLKRKEQLQFDIIGLDIISNNLREELIRVRCKGFYKRAQEDTFYKIKSNWVILQPNKKE
ncbi:hypothetical protein [Olleya sp. HaHaR_3_96]|uniref:hypothetical protein n=1 Tax=Olleya sp. HaHaR_3_96 TaxID=2745560 RepID=UPI001C4FF900|nr:hypothetical protein [Olleya sp. HaHaR_3_96]QXP60888.1 hypothetical protein H0I26_04420 [Olleya sp. HaHaR_3_96]